MFCKKCGTQFNGNICPNCGKCAEEEISDSFVEIGKDEDKSVGDGFETEKSNSLGRKDLSNNNLLSKFQIVYKFVPAVVMLIIGILGALCLALPAMTVFGENLGSIFENVKEEVVDTNVSNVCMALTVLSALTLINGAVQMYFSFKQPYYNVKKIAFWVADGLLCVGFLAIGIAASSVAKEDMLTVGSGFSLAIAIGIIGLVLTGAMIFYELKIFNKSLSAVTGIARREKAVKEKKVGKKLGEKDKKRIITIVIVCILVVAIVSAVIVYSFYIFRKSKVEKINIGDSKDRVVEILGEPHESNSYQYEYYSSNYRKLLKKLDKLDVEDIEDFDDLEDSFDKEMELTEKLESIEYKYIRVEFDSDSKVTSVFLDKKRCEQYNERDKTVKSFGLLTESVVRYKPCDLVYYVTFTDGSYYKGIAIEDYVCTSLNSSVSVTWTDKWNTEGYSRSVKVEDNPDILQQGNFGSGVNFDLDSENCLRISGDGQFSEACEIKFDVKSIVIGEDVTDINAEILNSSFNREKLNSIVVESGNEYYISENNALYSKSDNTLVLGCNTSKISGSAVAIGEYAFASCYNLTEITIPENIVNVGNKAFWDCYKLTLYCEANERPNGWSENWNQGSCPVVWDCKNQLYDENGYKYVEADGLKYAVKDGVACLKGNNASGDISIPSVIEVEGEKYSVKKINGYSFAYCRDLTSVVIPDSVTNTGSHVFKNCDALKRVVIGNGVTYLASYLFEDCPCLTDLRIGNSVSELGHNFIDDCDALTSLVIPESVTVVYRDSLMFSAYEMTFYCEAQSKPIGWAEDWLNGKQKVVWCYNNVTDDPEYDYVLKDDQVYLLKYKGIAADVTVPDTIKGKKVVSVGNAFNGNDKIKNVKLPDGIRYVYEYAFYDCVNLESVNIPDGVISLGTYVFGNCSSLTSIIVPDSVTSIGSSAFSGCGSLQSITLPFIGSKAGVTLSDTYQYPLGYIFGSSPYDGGTAVKQKFTTYNVGRLDGNETYYIPSSLKSVMVTGGNILDGAFSGCTGIEKVVICWEVPYVGCAFDDCNGITIYCEVAQKPIGWRKDWSGSQTVVWGYNNVTYNPEYDYFIDDGQLYLTKYKGTDVNVTVPAEIDGVKVSSIGTAFTGNDELQSVILPDGLKEIDDQAFSGCLKLTSVQIPDSVTCIGNYAFYNCSSLTSITIPDSVTSIGSSAFYKCSSLTSVNFGENSQLESIGSSAFYKCSSLTSITIPSSVTSIGDYAFSGCSSLASITISDSVTSIGSSAFYDCRSLNEVTIPIGVKEVGDAAFGSYYGMIVYCEAKSKPDGWDENWSGYEYALEPGLDWTPTRTKEIWDCNNNDKDKYGYAYTIVDGVKYSIKDGVAAVSCNYVKGDVVIRSSITYRSNTYEVVEIDDCAFGYNAITNIRIPAGIETVGDYVFYGCDRLIIYCEATSRPSSWSVNWNYQGGIVIWDCNNNEVASDGYLYVAIDGIRYGIKDGVATVVNNYDVSGDIVIADSITYKDISYKVTSISRSAFSNCSDLTGVTISNEVTIIEPYAFNSCNSLKSVIFENKEMWWCTVSLNSTSGKSISSSDLEDPAKAAEYLTDIYNFYYWRRIG